MSQSSSKHHHIDHKSSIEDLVYQYQGVKLPLLQMTDPYYPHSKLAKSVFQGYYILFFMYSVIFMITYPLLNFLQGKDLFGITIIKLVETNLIWDVISAVLFIFMALLFTQLSQMVSYLYSYILMAVTFITFMTSGIFIAKTYRMYFTDRIFIVVLNWALCAKTLTYIFDKKKQKQHAIQSVQWSKIEKEKKMNRIEKRLLYLISPLPVYHTFVQQHNPKLKIHMKYLMVKLLVSGLCLFVNNILIVKFIEPACHETSLSLIALSFKLIPLTFYINMTLYYMVMDNVIAALAEITRIQNRILYLDWWNAQTVYEFLDRWCLIINMATDEFLPNISIKIKHTLHGIILQILLLSIFGQSLSPLTCLGFIFILLVIYFLGGIRQIQNNMLVHVLCMSFTPVMIALEVKYSIFSKGFFD